MKKKITSKSIEISWSNWHKICDEVPDRHFITGVFLDETTLEEVDRGHSSNAVGLKIKNKLNITIMVRYGEFVVIENTTIRHKNSILNKKHTDVYQYVPRRVLVERF